jgi:ArsR family metal-binding transcriptional regulator
MKENSSSDCILQEFLITHILPCVADPDKNRVIAEFSNDISAVFPFLNATVANLIYNPGANSVSIKRNGRLLTFYPRGASLAKVDGAQDAQAQLTWFQTVCNQTWQRRAAITPRYERRKTVDPLDVYQLLPRINCQECGQATCWAFAWELLFGDLTLAACPHLSDPDYREGGRRLEELLG